MKNVIMVIFTPLRFARELPEKPVRLELPFILFVWYLVIHAIAFYILLCRFATAVQIEALGLPSSPDGFAYANWLFFTMGLPGFLVTLAFWVLGAGIMNSAAVLVDGEGDYKKYLEMTGYACAPWLIFALGLLLYAVNLSPVQVRKEIRVPTENEAMLVYQEEFIEVVRSEQAKPLTRMMNAFLNCSHFWVLLLWTISFKFNYKVSWTKAVLCVGCLGAFFGGLQYFLKWTIMGTLG